MEPIPGEVWPLDSDAAFVDEKTADEERREVDGDCDDDVSF